MIGFTTPLEIRHIGEQHFKLIAPLEYESTDYTIKIYDGFDFDGASIPQSLWSILGCPFGGMYSSPACLHDALYSTHLFNKKTSDKLFHEAMIASGVDNKLAKELYIGVRMFGDSAYNNKENLNKYRSLVEIIVKGNE